ncbi:MAG: fructose-6-phosphate aldolase [Dehalococcoidales bacterium]|jgi:transaldolase|nr:fructose-6-phosphate aldolase [Dehalococcoidales bacterium]MDP7285530.1 fructose-6-phosphate aldolase [Dehalococcoidales bacterium]MDP7415240.1 fructose-6-phosphate aldolase [Dehalococcoidales bacterium]|tara:strand:+ start:173 stop:823 length:651 start_codon:yes stop_codon:yes gene_type:complete
MHIFLDTANIDQIRQATKLGVISGVTTNPTLVAKEATADYEMVVKTICAIVSGSVSAEVLAEEADAMMEEARVKASWAPNVAVKIPITAAGLEATSVLSQENIAVNMTLCFSVNQALLAARAGASYTSPFVGRLDDIGHDGMQLVQDIVEVYQQYDLKTKVIAASIRHPLHCVVAARAGAHIATVTYDVLMQMINHPLTDIGISRFLADWKKVSPK